MKLTIEIPNENAHLVLSLLATIAAKPQEPQADPAPGHPELPLPDMPVNTVPQEIVDRAFDCYEREILAKAIPADPCAADPFKVAMDDPFVAEDPTRRELLWGDLPEPPPLPEGKTRWVNRGKFPNVNAGSGYAVGRRIVYYLIEGWCYSPDFSGDTPHIEAI